MYKMSQKKVATLQEAIGEVILRKVTRVYPKVSGLAAWSENCKWYSYVPLCVVVSLFCQSV
jgi:hypothetical protein